jgi:hypothetical protein
MEEYLPQLLGGGGWILHLLFYRIPKNASTSLSEHLGGLNLIKKHHSGYFEAQKAVCRPYRRNHQNREARGPPRPASIGKLILQF